MISISLYCYHGHTFEAWFLDEASFEQQRQENLIPCPHCGICDVEKVAS